MKKRILAFPEADVPAGLRRQVVRLHRQAWPGDGSGHDPALRPLTLLLVVDGDRVVSALDVLSKDISHGGERFSASGLSAVVTDEALRGRGYGRALVVAARERIGESGVDLGIFTCDRPLQGFYERAGWPVLPGAVLVGGTPERPLASDELDKVTLARFFSERAVACAGTFAGARIELYPGEIDRLW